MDDRKSLPFSDAVIHEVQRFLDIVPFSLPHYALNDISFRGYTIPKVFLIPRHHMYYSTRSPDTVDRSYSFNSC
uniref:Uncharacterized protein n=1 Tax=Oreochromis niloticus TaxID=8128 RepID=A0A669B9L0_ORENI